MHHFVVTYEFVDRFLERRFVDARHEDQTTSW